MGYEQPAHNPSFVTFSLFVVSFLIHFLYLGSVVPVEHRAAYLQCVGELAGLHGEGLGQEGEPLNLLIAGQLLLKGGVSQRRIALRPQQLHRAAPCFLVLF